ncbi:hypothetical protein AAY473_035673 [Plecturocebus cupreus]
MGWGKMACSRHRERKNRCFSEEDCRYSPGPGSLPRRRAARSPASWQRSLRRNHHSEAFWPLAAALPKTAGPPGGRDKPTCRLVFRERRKEEAGTPEGLIGVAEGEPPLKMHVTHLLGTALLFHLLPAPAGIPKCSLNQYQASE